MDRPQMGRGRLRAEQHKRSDTREVCGKREEGYSWGKIGGQLFCLLGGGSRSAAIAALGYWRCRENSARSCGSVWKKTQLVEGCGLRSSLSSLYTYVGAQSGRNGWMSVFSSLCIYSISQILAVVKNGKWKKMEGMEKSGRRGIARDGYAERGVWEGMEERLGGCHLRFSS